MEEAWQRFRIRFQHLHESVPAMIMLSTDGYPNSFRDFEGFSQASTDLLKIFATDGPEAIERDLPLWLTEASTLGSGDDVTLGLLLPVDPAPIEGEYPAEADVESAAAGAGDAAAASAKTRTSIGRNVSTGFQFVRSSIAWMLCVVFLATSVWFWMQHRELQRQRRDIDHLTQELTRNQARVAELEATISQRNPGETHAREEVTPASKTAPRHEVAKPSVSTGQDGSQESDPAAPSSGAKESL